MKNKNIIRVILGTALLLSIPLLGNWPWTFSDFVFMGVLLFGAGMTFVLVISQSGAMSYKIAGGLAVLASLVLVWGNAAVGLIGDDNSANLMYAAVILIGIIGAILARLQAHGMMQTLFAMAVAQALVPVIAFSIWPPSVISWAPGVLEVFILNGFFVMTFIISALLFQHAEKSKA